MISFAVPAKRICKRFQFFYQFMSFSSSSSLQSLDIADENDAVCPDYGELRRNMQNLANSGSIYEALQVFHSMRTIPGKPTVYDYNSLINSYLRSRNVCLHDLSALIMVMERVDLYPNASTFNTLLKGLNHLKESKVALMVIMEMCNYSFTPSFTCLSNLFKKCLGLMELLDAISVLDLMLELNYVPTEPSVISLINSLSRYGMTDNARIVFFKLSEKCHFQSPYMYNPILWSLCKSDQIDAALAFFCSLKKKGIIVNDVCSYTSLVYGFGKKGLFRDVFRCLRTMEGDDDCCPNLKTYTAIIKCLCDHGRTNNAFRLFGKMEKRGYEPDIVTYNIILRSLSRKNMVLAIYDLLETLNQKGISPDRYTATALSGLLKRGNIGIARNLLCHIVSSENDMDIAAYNVYFNCLYCGGDSEEASCLIRRLRESGKLNNVIFNMILKRKCEETTVDKGLEYFERVEWPEKRPDLVSFNTILLAACKKGDSVVVLRVIDLMEHEGIKLNVVGLTCLMKYFCNFGNINDCVDVFEHMCFHGPRPLMETIITLMIGLCKKPSMAYLEQRIRIFVPMRGLLVFLYRLLRMKGIRFW